MNERKVLKFEHLETVARAHSLWQHLFDFYRENDGDLSNMSDMVRIYKECLELCSDKQWVGKEVVFCFEEDFTYIYRTHFDPRGWVDMTAVLVLSISENEMTLSPAKVRNAVA